MEKSKVSTLMIRIPMEDHRKIKSTAAIEGKTIQEFIRTMLKEHLEKNARNKTL